MKRLVAETRYGKIEGKFEDELYAFLNIPYAKFERFLPATEPDQWDGVLDCTEYGPQQPQNPTLYHGDITNIEFTDKKGLNLNLWTPACDDKKRPVIVWIHGGGNSEGINCEEYWDGPNLVGGHDLVMVSIGYRLGFIGSLYLGDILGEKYAASGSLIDLDKIMALRWIRDNISNFGGDPESVTIMGQSGGAKSVGNLIVSPLAKGLFNQSVMWSGCSHCIRDLHTAKIITERFLKLCGLTRETADQMLTMSAEDIINFQTEYIEKYPHMFGPVIDGIVYTMAPQEYLQTGACDHLRIMMGYTREEIGCWPTPYVSPENRRNYYRERFGLNSKHVIELYNEYLKDCPEYEANQKIGNRFNYANGSIQFAEMLARRGISTWCYRWDWHGGNCAKHLSELSYVFRTSIEEDIVWGHSHEYDFMSTIMNTTLVSFVKNGDPNNEHIPGWKPYTDVNNGNRLYISDNTTAEPFSLDRYDHKFNFMEFQLP